MPATVASIAEQMSQYAAYAFVADAEGLAPKALFRGRVEWASVEALLAAEPETIVETDERAAGFTRYRLYGTVGEMPLCLAEIEIYFARGEGRTTFWCKTDAQAGALSLAA